MYVKRLSIIESLRSSRTPLIKRRAFLQTMEDSVPWEDWLSLIRPFYHEGRQGRPPVQLETILRMYLIQIWFNLSAEAAGEGLYDSAAFAWFAGVDPFGNNVPDATTLLKFRHLPEKHNLCERMFSRLNEQLEKKGIMMRGGTIVDATVISAPGSTKNKDNARDPEMHQTKKGNQWYHGMKSHIGVDAGSGLVHTMVTTAANVSDVTVTDQLIREDDVVVYGDSGYTGAEKRPAIADDKKKSKITFRINKKRSTVKTSRDKKIEAQNHQFAAR